MAQRRSHQKSRHGCLECKRRRVKCDESRPVCANCARRQTDCEYDSSGPLRWMTDEPSRSPRPLSDRQQAPPSPDFSLLGQFRSNNSSNNGDTPLPPLNLCDLELMLQWVNETYAVLSRSQHTEDIWRTYVPEEGVSHPFLMHGILALAAVHIAQTRVPRASGDNNVQASRDYLQIAVSHQNQALALFREQLGDVNPTNGKAMFAFASITVLYAFGFPRTPDPGSTAVGDLVQAFVLVRGVQHVLSQAMSTIFEDRVWAPIRQVNEYDPTLPIEARAAIDQLHKANEACTRQDPILHDSALYQEAIDHLADLMAAINAGLGFALACRWAIKLQPAFVDRIRDRRPLALAILAHWCALLIRLQDVWFGIEWGTRVAQEIWYVLDDNWRPLIHGCMEQIFGKQYLMIER
ncbi:hypothetical protein BJY01DRAFT_108590 [Aspergillus pseudoustus]|uniref:Zn(2)-C6 fungal-type domain-containing protein n=1 Tax=Aspergillus pseudoustus TaxID=1810923 RepID=A0ABR4IUR5_9EURO